MGGGGVEEEEQQLAIYLEKRILYFLVLLNTVIFFLTSFVLILLYISFPPTFTNFTQNHPLSYFSFQPVLHDWCNKGCGMCYPVCGMVHIKEPLLLIGKSSLCGGSGFPFSLSELSLTICLTPNNRKYNVLSASLNKTFLSLSLLSTFFFF